MQGYRVLAFNLVDLDDSDGYNPFSYIREDNDIIKLVTNLMRNTTPKGATSSDPFWDNALSLYLQAIMSYVWYECPKQGKEPTVREMMNLLTKAKVAEEEGNPSELDQIMEKLSNDHPAKIAYNKVATGAKDTIRSIIISAHARLAYLQNPKILNILDHDDIDIRAIGEGVYGNPDRKTALFCIIPDNDKSYNFLIGMLYTQIFQELYYIADFEHGGALPVHVAFWMDEFANVALPDGFTQIISTMRSRNISCNIILQNRAQLQALFKDDWQAIIGNCDTMIYLGGNEAETHKYMTEMLGKYTQEKRSTSQGHGKSGSGSDSYDVIGRELMTPDEVRRMSNKKELVFIRGFNPVIDDKYHTLESQEFKVMKSLGMYKSKRLRRKDEETHKINYYLYSQNDKGDYDSFGYQVENYHGVFAQSSFFNKLEKIGDGKYLAGKGYMGYRARDGRKVYPVFDNRNPQKIFAGGNTLTKYPLCGCIEDEKVYSMKAGDINDLFATGNRVSTRLPWS